MDRATGQVVVQWKSGSDSFQPEAKPELNNPFWKNSGLPAPVDNGSFFTVNIPITENQFFVRLGPVFNTCIKDDTTGDRLALNSMTGSYQLTRANGEIYSGTGALMMTGSLLTLQHSTLDRNLVAHFNSASQTGDASLETPPGTTRVVITDSNTGNNDCP